MINDITSQLRRDEGEKLSVYNDHLGFATIGVGRLVDSRKGGGITAEESAYLLQNDIKKRELELDKRLPWWRQLSAPRQGVLLNMAFQMGVTGLMGFTNTLEHARKGDYKKAADNMLASKWAEQTPERAKRLASQMLTDSWL